MTPCFAPNPPAFIWNAPQFAVLPTNTVSRLSLLEQRVQSLFDAARRELDRYRMYGHDWDGYSASPFDRNVLESARNILEFSEGAFLELSTVPTLVTTGPASDGSIDVEIRVGERRGLVTLYPDDNRLHFSSIQNEESHENIAEIGTEPVARWLAWLHHSTTLSGSLA